jgi:hypothetical protein
MMCVSALKLYYGYQMVFLEINLLVCRHELDIEDPHLCHETGVHVTFTCSTIWPFLPISLLISE